MVVVVGDSGGVNILSLADDGCCWAGSNRGTAIDGSLSRTQKTRG